MPFEPWSKYPTLTKAHLSIIGGIVRGVRSDTAELHDSGGGDNSWSLGCRAYARTCFALRKASEAYTWLTIVSEDQYLKFTFAIESTPIRFYHGEASDPPSKYLERTIGELRQLKLPFNMEVPVGEVLVLRLAIETDAKGRASTIALVEVGKDSKPTGNIYVIPPEERTKVVPMRSKGIDLPPPLIEPIVTEAQKKQKKKDQQKKERDAG